VKISMTTPAKAIVVTTAALAVTAGLLPGWAISDQHADGAHCRGRWTGERDSAGRHPDRARHRLTGVVPSRAARETQGMARRHTASDRRGPAGPAVLGYTV
jgi:hypothetical protein